ncbi:hypothetical protein K470DRAFT_261073 [Piedraia hortae CBS 480.64]|uniref:Pleckstrin homology domain-containing protein n=1 Tax=Piedraia hortae CBS 480.64 TaxID=1314780 RepID=A0A6A7BR26_9PEZI|nr:hypothetical protein K470DRAFT_261073 [Piedraia hortae CBS 480.64]
MATDMSSSPPPPYDCTVGLVSNLLYKSEFISPFHRATDRRWKRVQATLRGTLLAVQSPLISRSWGLQHAQAGLAVDYEKRPFVLRVRTAEGAQFLLAAADLSTLLEWVKKLNWAIDISLPLDDRIEPVHDTLPRSIRRPFPNTPGFLDVCKCICRAVRRKSRMERCWLQQAPPKVDVRVATPKTAQMPFENRYSLSPKSRADMTRCSPTQELEYAHRCARVLLFRSYR